MGLFFGFILGWASQIGSVRGASCRWYGLFSLYVPTRMYIQVSSHERMDIKTNLNFHQPKCASSSHQRWGFTNSNVEIRWYNQFDIGTNGPVSGYVWLLFGIWIRPAFLGMSFWGAQYMDSGHTPWSSYQEGLTASRLRLLWSWGRESSWTFGFVWK